MAQYTYKSALIAEIESSIRSLEACLRGEFPMAASMFLTEQCKGRLDAYKNVLSLINALEVKEVDLEKVFLDEYSKFSNDIDAMDYAFPIDLADYKDFAKHFFELGLKVNQKGE